MTTPDVASDLVLLARILRPQGRNGELLAEILTDFPDRFAQRKHLLLLPPSGTETSTALLERHWLHKGRVVLKFAGVDSISDADRFRGWTVALSRAERVPLEPDAFYIGDLIGCLVQDETSGVAAGRVIDIERGSNGAADMLLLEDDVLIPFAKSYLIEVDLQGRIIRMRLPEGLLAVNGPLTDEERSRARDSDT